MSSADQQDNTDTGEAENAAEPIKIPHTGNAQIDTALAQLADLNELSASEKYEKLSAAHEVIASVLDDSRNA